MIKVLVVNINGLGYTVNLINDLLGQTHPFKLRLVDQNSSEYGTREYFNCLGGSHAMEIIINDRNVDLNRLWNDLYITSTEAYLCFLNNDLRVPTNFIEDTIAIFEKEPEVGCVLHATNHPEYQETTELSYVVMKENIVQGWAFTLRREAYTLIPEQLRVFGGDDFLFINMCRQGWKTAMCTSSPVIHYRGRSRKFFEGDRNEEVMNLKELGYERLPYRSQYTKPFPQFDTIKERLDRGRG